MKRDLKEPLAERIVLIAGVLLALVTAIGSQYSSKLRYMLFGTGEDAFLSQPVGAVTQISGRCERKARDEFSFEAMQSSQPLYVEDTIVSGTGSTCVLVLVGDMTVELGPDSLVRLSRALVLPGADGTAALSLQKGAKVRKSDASELEALKFVLKSAPPLIPPAPRTSAPSIPKSISAVPTLVSTKSPARPAPRVFDPAAVPTILSKDTVVPPPPVVAEQVPTIPATARWKVDLASQPVALRGGRPVIDVKFAPPPAVAGEPPQPKAEFIELVQPNGKVVSRKKAGSDARGKVDFEAPAPGVFRVRILGENGTKLAENSVTVPRDLTGLKLDAIKKVKPAPILNWEKLPDAKTYRVVVEDAKTGKLIADKTGLKNTALAFTGIQPSRTYRYRVYAETNAGFRIASPTVPLEYEFSPAEIKWPAHDDQIKLVKGKRQLISWNRTDRTQSYVLEIATEEGFQKVIFQKPAVLNFAELLVFRKGTYYARVRCFTDYGKIFIGPTRRFSIDVVN